MTPLEFLAEVLPPPGNGYYCVAELSNKKEHVYKERIEDLQPYADAWCAKGYNVFYALATFKEVGKRTAQNARFLKALFIDMDGYETKKAAGESLNTFIEKTGLAALGRPWIVASGGGIHCYWPLNEKVEVNVWKPVASKLKRLCAQEGMRIDMGVTADAARVLRYPDTKNFKKKYDSARLVKILVEGDHFEFDDIAKLIDSQLRQEFQPLAPTSLPGVRPKGAKGAGQVKLYENTTTSFELLMEKTDNGEGCAQIKNYVDNATEDGMEPLWRGLLSWTKCCEDGPAFAEWLSDLHPYDRERMQKKVAEIKGPYPCAKMDDENPGLCQTCPHWGKITNPLVLGRKLVTDNTEKTIVLGPKMEEALQKKAKSEAMFADIDEAVATDEELKFDSEADFTPVQEEEVITQQTVVRPKPPRGFSYGKTGGVYVEKVTEAADGTEKRKEIQLLPYDLFVVDILKQEGEHIVHMAANRPDGAVTITLPQKAVVSKDETVKNLAAQNVIASYGKKNDDNLFNYVRAAVEEASLTKRAIEVPKQCGWQADGSFVYNYRIFKPDGREITIPMPGLENINRATNSAGTFENWKKFWDLMVVKNMDTMLAFCLDSFGAPLMSFTEYEGFVWHMGSTESGTGKSLTLSAKAGVWGHPVRFRTSKGTSPVAMQNRAGLLNSMPLLVDEITAKQRNDMEWAPAFIFDISEGQGKDRMNSGSNSERINDTTWATTCSLTSNVHLIDYMSGARAHSSNGELLRMLEWTPTVPLVWTEEDREALRLIKSNYGVAAPVWIRWLVNNRDTASRVLRSVTERLKVVMNFSDDERYWHTGCATTVAAGILLGPKYANIMTVPVQRVVEALKKIVEANRGNLRKNVRSAEDVLNAYTREFYGNFIILRKSEGGLLSHWGTGELVDKSTTRSRVLGRVEHGVNAAGYVDYFIEEQMLKLHCVSMSFGYSDFKKQLADKYEVHYTKKDMLARTNGPAMRVNVMHIIRKAEDVEDPQVDGALAEG